MKKNTYIAIICSFCFIGPSQSFEPVTTTVAGTALVGTIAVAIKNNKHCETLCNRHFCSIQEVSTPEGDQKKR